MSDSKSSILESNAGRPSPEINLQQMSVLFSEISTNAGILYSLLLGHSEDTGKDSFHAVHRIAQQIGYLADKGCETSGTSQFRGGAEEWFLPPSYSRKPSPAAIESTRLDRADRLEPIRANIELIRDLMNGVENERGNHNAVSRGIYAEIEPLARQIDNCIHAFYDDKKPTEAVDVGTIDEISELAVSLVALCQTMKALPNGTFDLASIENIVFKYLHSINNHLEELK